MDLKEVPTTSLLGDIIGFFAPMNGGKTEGMVQELRRAKYYNLNAIAYNNEKNTRERNAIVVDGRDTFPAVTVNDISELRQDFEERRALVETYLGVPEGEIELKGIHHQKGFPLQVVAIDEINLFCLNDKEAGETLDFLTECKKQDIATFVSGLLYDFRQFPFGQVHCILPYVDIRQEKKPACMAIGNVGIKCTNTAKHTQRLWRKDFVQEQDLEELLLDSTLGRLREFGFVHKDKRRFLTEYVPAPFFDETLRIEEERQMKVVYLPVCTNCASVPYKSETFMLYKSIEQGKDPAHTINPVLIEPIFRFLISENWVKEEAGKYTILPYFRNSLGGFFPGR